jgi:hypothetical protein
MWNVSAAAMSEFKYACPVCGQHIKCDSSQAGTRMECPTFFQKITVPQAPSSEDQKFIITGTKVGKRPVSTFREDRAVEAEKNFSTALLMTAVILVCIAVAAVYVFRGKILKSTSPAAPTNQLASGLETNSTRPAAIQLSPAQLAPRHGAIGLGTWNTEAEYSNVVVTKGTDTLYRSDFQPGAPGWRASNGRWIATNNVFIQTAQVMDVRAFTGDTAWSDYTVSLKARKLGGREGFRVLFNVQDDQNWTLWNLGGWNNATNAIEACANGVRAAFVHTNQPRIMTGPWYDIRIEIQGVNMRCYLNDQLIHDATYPSPEPR